MTPQAESTTDLVIGSCPGCGAPIYESDKVWVVGSLVTHAEEYCLVRALNPVRLPATVALAAKVAG